MKLDELKHYKTEIDEVKAWNLVRRYCKDAIKDMDTPIVRGMRQLKNGFGVFHGAIGGRESANTSNYYTVILDHVLSPLGFPKRSGSIICSSWKSRKHSTGYGVMHAIIPFDGVKIGVCPYADMWETEIFIGKRFNTIQKWNREFKYMGVKDTDTFEKMLETLELAAETKAEEGWKYSDEYWMKEFLDGKSEETLKKAYTKPFKLATTKDSHIYNDGKPHEVWVGGKCVAIELNLYKKMMSNPDISDDDLNGWDED